MKIAYTKPSISQIEIDYVTDAASNGWGEKCYDYIIRFEKEFSEYIGTKHAIATSSCTGAITLGISALGIGEGDEVILADTNWIATASPIVHSGAQPVFVDVLADTWCIDPCKAERAITKRTKAIVATHLYGNLCDMDALSRICNRHGLALIEDSAEAIGSIYKGKRAGSMGTFSTFSFHGTKTITTGEGGMFLTSDSNLFDKALTLSNHGRARNQTKQFWADELGFKFKMSNIQAAIGCAQLVRINELIDKKRKIFQQYSKHLSDLPIKMNTEPLNMVNGYWMPTIVVDEEISFERELLLEKFKCNGIDARVFFWPLSMLPMFDTQVKNKVSYGLCKRGINLPSYHDLENSEIQKIVKIYRSMF